VPKALVIDNDLPRRRTASHATEGEGASDGFDLKRIFLRNPKDLAAGAVAAVAVVAIMANAMFMQAGRHPAPMFNAAFPVAPGPVAMAPAGAASGPLPRPRPADADIRPVESRANEPAAVVGKAAPAPAASSPAPRPPASIQAHADPVGDLISSTRRIAAVQRALTEFGYGQLKPTGVAGTDTQAAIQKFERERKLPVTGQVTDRLVRELSAATGRAID
jgi:hypothetical protein